MSFFLDKNEEISFIISNSRVNAPDATHNVDFWPLFPSKIVGQAMEKQEGNCRLYLLILAINIALINKRNFSFRFELFV